MKQLFTMLLMAMVSCWSVPTIAKATPTTSPQQQTQKQNKVRTTSLWGHVKDSFTKVGVSNVKITLMREDSTVIDTGRVFVNGSNALKPDYAYKFTIPAEAGRYIILAQHPDYEDTYVNYHIRYVGRNKYFDAPWHYMKRRNSVSDPYQGEALREVTVKGTRVKIAYKGDTIVYDASAFKLPDGSMLDALVRQLPGAELKDDGTILVNGRKVDYLTLNGKDFFKGNNKVMLDNLPYFTVQNIKVYDKTTDKSRYIGRDVEKKEYVMDVNLKKQYRTGYIGNVAAGGATSDRYMGRLFLSRFTDHSKVTAFANVNNINETRTPEKNGEWNPSNSPEGKTTNRMAGLNIQTDGKDAMYKNTLDVTALWNDYANNQTYHQTNFQNEGNSYYLVGTRNDTQTRQLTFKNSFNLQLPIWVVSNTEFSIGDNDDDMHTTSATLNKNTDRYGDTSQALDSIFSPIQSNELQQSLLNRMRNNSTYHDNQLFLSQQFIVNKKLPWGDNLELEVSGNYKKRENKTFEDYRLSYIASNAPADNRNTYRDVPIHSYGYTARMEYYFNFRNNMTLRLYSTYEQGLKSDTEDYYRLDQLEGWENGQHLLGSLPSTADSLMAVRSLLNSKYQRLLTRSSKNGLNLIYRHNTDSTYTYMQFHLPLFVRNEKINYQHASVDTCASRTKTYLDGDVNMLFAWKNFARQLFVSMAHRTLLPEMSSLVTFDYSNPLSISRSNPDLKQGHEWNVSSEYQHRMKNMRSSFGIFQRFGYATRPVLTGYGYNKQTGAYVYQPQNGDYDWKAELGLWSYGTADKKEHWHYGFRATYSYRGNQVMELPQGDTQSRLAGRSSQVWDTYLSLDYRKGDFSTGFSGSFKLQDVDYKTVAAQSYHTKSSTLTYFANYTIPVIGIFVGSSFSWYRCSGSLNSSPSQDNYVWNANLGKSFLKGKKLTVSLNAFDMLNSVSNYSYSVFSDRMIFKTTDRIGRYVMLLVAYKLNIQPAKK